MPPLKRGSNSSGGCGCCDDATDVSQIQLLDATDDVVAGGEIVKGIQSPITINTGESIRIVVSGIAQAKIHIALVGRSLTASGLLVIDWTGWFEDGAQVVPSTNPALTALNNYAAPVVTQDVPTNAAILTFARNATPLGLHVLSGVIKVVYAEATITKNQITVTVV